METFGRFLDNTIKVMWLLVSFGFKFVGLLIFLIIAFGPIILLIAKLLE